MIYLQLFLSFFKIGLVSFGGGYAMIPLVMDECISSGWMNESELLNLVAVVESMPGPIAVDLATFIGSSQAGFLGSVCSIIGVILPSFIIIILIAALVKNLFKLKIVQSILSFIRPVVVGLIISTGIILFLQIILGISTIKSSFVFNYKELIIFTILTTITLTLKFSRNKNISPILLILISGIMGVIMF